MTQQGAFGTVTALPLSIDNFELQLEAPGSGRQRPYRPGDVITGKLSLGATENFQCLGVYVVLEGSAVVNYQSGHAMRTRTENLLPFEWNTVCFLGYPPDKVPIDSNNQPVNVTVKKSNHEFNFTIPIKKLNPFPGTFVGTSGEISYKVVGYVDTGYVANTKTATKIIKIRSYLDLHTVPATLKPSTVEDLQYKSIFSKKTDLKFSFTLQRTGYVPHEHIPFTLTVLNPYRKNITRAYVALGKKVGYTSDLSSRWSKSVLDAKEMTDSAFFASESTEWTDSLHIPRGIYPTVQGYIVQHLYSIRVELFLDGKDQPTLKADVPLTIGTRKDHTEAMSPVESNDPFLQSPSLNSLSLSKDIESD